MLNKDAIEAIRENHKPTEISIGRGTADDTHIIAVPNGMKLESIKKFLDENREKPDRRAGPVTASDTDSFIRLVSRFKAENSVLFSQADISDSNFTALLQGILNYHPEGPNNAAADWGDHVIRYYFPLSAQLELWLGRNKASFNGKEFSQFLEDNSPDLVVADPARFETAFGEVGAPVFATPSAIVALSRGIELRVDEKVTQAFRISDGTMTLQYSTENKDTAGQPLKLPEWFALGIPLFKNGPCYQLPVRLRFRQSSGNVTWFYELFRKEDVFTAAFKRICEDVQKGTGLPLFNAKSA